MHTRGIFISLVVLLLTAPLIAQINTGTIFGTVRDSQGAVVPGADVTVTLTSLGDSVVLSTNEAGVYQAAGLRPGMYQVRAETDGFKTAVRDEIRLAIQQRLEVGFTLEVGDVTEQVQVVAPVVGVETESGQLGTVIEAGEIADLPLDGRRYSDLILLSPGAVPAPGARSNPREARIVSVRAGRDEWLGSYRLRMAFQSGQRGLTKMFLTGRLYWLWVSSLPRPCVRPRWIQFAAR